MKKALLVVCVLILAAAGVFHQYIFATIDHYQFQNENATVFAKAELDWVNIPFSSATNRGLVEDSLTFSTIQFPLPFAATKSSGSDAAFAIGANQSVSIAHTSEARDFLETHELADGKRNGFCSFLSKTSSRGACHSNYSLYRAVLELNETDIHLFSSIKDKGFYNQVMVIRADMLPSQRVSGFETSRFQGFLFSEDSHTHVAKLFDQQDQQYDVTFTNIPESQVTFMLSNMTIVAN